MAQPTALIRLQVRRGFALLQGQSNASAPTVTRVYELRVDKGLQLAEGIRCWRRNPELSASNLSHSCPSMADICMHAPALQWQVIIASERHATVSRTFS